MSLQWTFVASFLYIEIFLCFLLMLPFVSPTRWKAILRSRILGVFRSYANLYFNILIVVLIILFVDSIRDVYRYSEPLDELDLKNNPSAENVLHMKLFRAQRNLYIAGFALFLFVVLRRLVTLISQEATLIAENTALKTQAEGARQAAQTMMDEKDKERSGDDDARNEDKEELNATKVKLTSSRNDLSKATTDLETMKKQAESTNREYDRLLKEHAELQAKLQRLEGGDESKKDS